MATLIIRKNDDNYQVIIGASEWTRGKFVGDIVTKREYVVGMEPVNVKKYNSSNEHYYDRGSWYDYVFELNEGDERYFTLVDERFYDKSLRIIYHTERKYKITAGKDEIIVFRIYEKGDHIVLRKSLSNDKPAVAEI